MSDVIEYKCPFCGGAMEFDSKSQHMKCLYCNTEMTVEDVYKRQSAYCVDAQKMADAVGLICWGNDDKIRYFSQILFHDK